MNPSQGFEDGQEGYDIAVAGQFSHSNSNDASENAYQMECDLRACKTRLSVLEGRREGNDLQAPCEGISTDASI